MLEWAEQKNSFFDFCPENKIPAKKEHSAKLLLIRVFRDWRTAKKYSWWFFYARVNFVTADFS